jgi:CHASE2 domain-containing sensor protein
MSQRNRSSQKRNSRRKGNLLTHLRSATWVVLSVSVATFLLHHFGWLNSFETSSLDFLVRLREPVRPKYVWLVGITDRDYAELFAKSSPLEPARLRELITAAAQLKPRVIGVDIDTSDSRGVRPETDVPIIWGQRIMENPEPRERRILPVLGNEQPQPGGDELGISALPADEDGSVRRYRRKIPVESGWVDSLPWAVTKAFCRKTVADSSSDELRTRCEKILRSESLQKYQRPLLLNFSEPRHTEVRVISASDLLRTGSAEGWQNNPTFRDGIVMLGGTFPLSGDISYKTPVGTRAGVQLFSDAIETELQQSPITPLNELLMVVFEIIGGYSLAAWHFVSRNWGAVVLRVVAVPVLAIASSFLAFSSLAYWVSFIPVLVGVLLHESHEHFNRYRSLIKRAHEMDMTIHRLQKRRRHR